jgi:hypothetical protein
MHFSLKSIISVSEISEFLSSLLYLIIAVSIQILINSVTNQSSDFKINPSELYDISDS